MLKLYISIDIEFAELLDKTEEENNEKESIQDFDFNSPVLKPETLQISLLKKKRKFGFYKSEYQNNIIKIIPPPPERTC